jgi:hypothetical protein
MFSLKRKFRSPSDPFPRSARVALKVGKSVPVLRPIAFRIAVSRIGGTPKPSYLTRKYRKHLKYPIQRKAYDLKQTRNWYRLTSRAEAVADTLHTLKPYRWVAIVEHGRADGGSEEGGWDYAYSQPTKARRVMVWRATSARDALALTLEPVTDTRARWITPADADRDPMADYTEADDRGWRSDERIGAEVSTRKPVREPRSRPYYC